MLLLTKTLYATYLEKYICRSQAGKWFTLMKFSEEVFWRRFLRYQQYHATYSLSRKEEYFKLLKDSCWNNSQDKEIYYYMYPNGYCLFWWYVQKLQIRKTISEHSISDHSTLEALTRENDIFPTDLLKNEEFKWSSTRSINTEEFQLEEYI